MKPKKNDILTLDVTGITDLGFGVAHADGFVIFVNGGVTGDTVKAKIIKAMSSYAVANVLDFLHLSELRVNNRCTLPCKSCAYREISYTEECRMKEEGVREDFIKAGLSDVAVLPLIPSPATCRYRNKAQYPIALLPDGSYRIGFYAPKSHRVTEAADCPLSPAVFRDILEELRAFFSEKKISVYEEESGKGLLRHVYLRRGEVSGEILLTLVINGERLPAEDEFAVRLTEKFPHIVGILLNENRESTNVVLGSKYRTLYGRNYMQDTLAGVSLRLEAPAFYQVNHDCAELLYAKAKELAEPQKDEVLLDLFCGVGSIGLSMAKEVKELIGIEIVPEAVECAEKNAKDNGMENASFYIGDAAETEKLLARAEAERGDKILPDTVVLDPPRAGCDERLIRFVSSLSPKKIVYISCNPKTLARDCVLFRELGYQIGGVTPVDMFPGTGHVETVVLMPRNKE